jgi:hypothetical protein
MGIKRGIGGNSKDPIKAKMITPPHTKVTEQEREKVNKMQIFYIF